MDAATHPDGHGELWRAGPVVGEYTVLPDGCMDLIWTGTEVLIAGPDTAPYVGRSGRGWSPTGFRFRPGAGPGVIGGSAHEFRDLRVPVDDVWTRERVGMWTERLAAAEDPGRVLAELCTERSAPASPWIAPLIAMLRGGFGVAECADSLSVSERTLHRMSLVHFGYGAKMLARILRMRVVALGLLAEDPDLSAVAYRAGYADYAHMFRELVDLAGRSPAEFRQVPTP